VQGGKDWQAVLGFFDARFLIEVSSLFAETVTRRHKQARARDGKYFFDVGNKNAQPERS